MLKVLVLPNKILKSCAEHVEEVNDEIRQIMNYMLDAMYKGNGVGLAANQVGILKRIIVIDLDTDDDQDRPEGFFPMFLANPVIVNHSENYLEAKEGCLSLPGVVVSVTRPDDITVEYIDYNNKKQTISTSGWLARSLHHEIDHLNGVTLIDYLSPLKRSIALKKLKKHQKEVA